MSELEHVIIGTAGHIDHGKTALVKALTGIEADTLPEEKSRGMTIELGFVFMEIPQYEKQIVFIDVPGHEKFVKTMVAGASNIDGALFIIAADEGISLQTREHFDILHLLGIKRGIIALTKKDLVDELGLKTLTSEVKSFVKDTFLEGAPIIPASVVTLEGVDLIKEELIALGNSVDKRTDSGIFRMPVDRVFTMKGFGTVIAGTVLSGEVKVGDSVEIYPDGIKSRVRGIQVHDVSRQSSVIGRRTAVNLHDVKKEDLRRGQVCGKLGQFVPSYRLDTRLFLLKSHGKPLKNRTRVRLHVGTDERIGRVILLDKEILSPGESGLVQFALEAPTVSLVGDAFVIRSFSPVVTIGGGRILDGNPVKHKRLDRENIQGIEKLEKGLKDKVEQMFIKTGFKPLSGAEIAVSLDELESEVEETVAELKESGKIELIESDKGKAYIHQSSFEILSSKMMEFIQTFFKKNPHLLLMPYADLRSQVQKISDVRIFQVILDRLIKQKAIFRKDTSLGLFGREKKLNPREQEMIARIEKIYKTQRFTTPLEEDIRSQLRLHPNEFKKYLKELFETKKLVRLSKKVTYHMDTLNEARDVALNKIKQRGSITVAELRDRLRISRKYAQAVLEYFNQIGLTVRKEDKHVLK